MNNFIVWDEDEREFYIVDTMIGTINGYKVAKVKPLPENCDSECYSELKVFDWDYSDEDKIFKPIGIKDINNNPIYADCSIVEFEFFETLDNMINIKGYFQYHKESLSYLVYIFEYKRRIEFLQYRMRNFKIIDTIQENKLGLING